MPGNGRATLATIAAAAGVSVATVSKVVNERSDVGPATRGLVQNLLEQHNYVGRRTEVFAPGVAARPTVELVFYGRLSAYTAEVMQGVLDAAAESRVGVAVSALPRTAPGAARHRRSGVWLRDVVSSGRRAVIAVVNELTAADLAVLSRAALPIVAVDPIEMPRAEVTSVGSTNFAGGVAATQHLLSLGHRRIAYVGGPRSAMCNQARMHGYRGAMEAGGVPVPQGYVRTGPFRYQDGVVTATALLELADRPTAVFAASDEIALGVIEAARAQGRRVPEDLSVVGFDDTQIARLGSPPLTTIRQPLQDMGRVALRTALRLAAGEKVDSNHVELATELVVRASTAPPPFTAASVKTSRRA
jgi:LacI family transcriptional regulator